LLRKNVSIALSVTALLCGCTAKYHREKADREAYSIIEDAERAVLGEGTEFTIDTHYSPRTPGEIDSGEIVGDRMAERRLEINLVDALTLAVENSREYQTRKENLYLAALELSRQRYEFGPQFFAGGDVSAERMPNGERRGRVGGQAGVNQLLQTGGRITSAISTDVLQILTGNGPRTATTVISLNLVQPLLRGAGREIVAENLTQADRNVIYEVRSFAHYQQTFSVRIAASYYRILQQQDAVRNEYNSYRNLTVARERAEALARDRLPEFQADQARQDELRARNRYVIAVERYLNALDLFKTELGIPIGYHLVLDEQPLRDLEAAGLPPVTYVEEEAIAIAIESRLDLLNEIDRFEDAVRRTRIAANQLRADVNLLGGVSVAHEGTDYSRFDLSNYRASVGLGIDLPIDRLRERNLYRSSIIQFERQIRSLSLAIDQVRNDIRQSLRTLDQAHQTFLIQQRAVEVADRRLEAANLLLEAGRSEMRDLLEAETAQLQARNALTQALLDYHIARYEFLRNMGILEVDEEGFWIRDLLASPTGTEAEPPQQLLDADTVITPEQLFAR